MYILLMVIATFSNKIPNKIGPTYMMVGPSHYIRWCHICLQTLFMVCRKETLTVDVAVVEIPTLTTHASC